MRSWYRDTAERHRATPGTGIRGTGTPDWTNPDVITVTPCRFQPAGATETDASWILLAPCGADILAEDRIHWQDAPGGPAWLEVIGDAEHFRGITGATAHSRTLLRRPRG